MQLLCPLECPPLLFETRSGSDCGVSFGGVPTVYLHNGVPSADSLFHIRSLASGEQVRAYVNFMKMKFFSISKVLSIVSRQLLLKELMLKSELELKKFRYHGFY